MNERIKQLAEQANVSFGEGLEFAVVFGELKDFERFTKLVIKECAAYVEGTGNWLVAMEMEEHFGVEE